MENQRLDHLLSKETFGIRKIPITFLGQLFFNKECPFLTLFNLEGTLGNGYGGIAQLGEHLLCKQGVIGSIPIISTNSIWARSSAG